MFLQDNCMEYQCNKCGKQCKSHVGLTLHEKKCGHQTRNRSPQKWICPKCGYEIKNSREKHLYCCNGYGPRRRQPIKRGTAQSNLRLSENTKELWNNIEFRDKVIKGIKKAYSEGRCSGRANTIDGEVNRKVNISNSMKLNPLCGGLRHGSGRGKKGWYKGYWCDSTWELAYVIYCLDHGIQIRRNSQGFEYTFEGKLHKYYPDFILEDGSYVEIKGYMSEQNKSKIEQFEQVLVVIDKQNIVTYIDYTITKYGNSFEDLYEGSST